MADFAAMRTMNVWTSRLDTDEIERRWVSQMDKQAQKRYARNVAKARAKDSVRAFKKLVTVVDGRPRLTGDPPLIVPLEDLLPHIEYHRVEEGFRVMIGSYRRSLQGDHRRLVDRYDFVGAARKVVGVGSVGTRAWVVLMLGKDLDDPLFLQAKEAQTSVLEPFLGKSKHANHGQRVVEGQRLMQAASDVLLGWVRTDGVDGVTRDFYVRQMWDGKGSAVIEAMDPATLAAYGRLCGWTLARAHARSGDPVAISSYLGTSDRFDRSIATFAETYADQNDRDFAALRDAVEQGRVSAETGV